MAVPIFLFSPLGLGVGCGRNYGRGGNDLGSGYSSPTLVQWPWASSEINLTLENKSVSSGVRLTQVQILRSSLLEVYVWNSCSNLPKFSILQARAKNLHSFPVAYQTMEVLLTWSGPSDLRALIFRCHMFLPFHTVPGVLGARILQWFAIPFPGGPRFVRTLHHDLSVLGGPTWHSFTELRKTHHHNRAVIHEVES